MAWISRRKGLTQSYPANYPSSCFMNEHLGLGACRGMANTGCLMVTHHAYESLFSTDGSPLLWVVLRLQPFWGIFTYFFFFVVCFVFPHWYARLYKSHRDVNHRRRRLLCCCHLKGIFLVGVAETIFFFFFFLYPCHRRRKKRRPSSHRTRKKRTNNSRRMLPHSTLLTYC